ncbi:MAG: serine/threonine protein kinase, partial [Synergistales bacterium]|nr:serine/threonine protein kinase [Synergistales bacterium]
MDKLSKNFNRKEFACKCGCGHDNVSPVLVNLLQELRDHLDRAVHVHSGCRCEAHNKAVGGVS